MIDFFLKDKNKKKNEKEGFAKWFVFYSVHSM
jgi:hypothetical protein